MTGDARDPTYAGAMASGVLVALCVGFLLIDAIRIAWNH